MSLGPHPLLMEDERGRKPAEVLDDADTLTQVGFYLSACACGSYGTTTQVDISLGVSHAGTSGCQGHGCEARGGVDPLVGCKHRDPWRVHSAT